MPNLMMRAVDRLVTGQDLRELSVEQVQALRVSRIPEDAPGRDLLVRLALKMVGSPHPATTAEMTTVAGADGELALRVTRPRDLPAAPPLVVHLHGGGWVLGSPTQYDWLCSRIAHGVGAIVASVDYRKAPEHPAPAAVDDALAATVALLDEAPQRFGTSGPAAIVGDSAGGNLATLVALDRRDAGDERLAAQWLVYPSTDLARSFPSHERLADALVLPAARIDQFLDLYLAGQADATDPRLSPWYAEDVAGVAPALVQLAELDPLVDEGAAWAGRLEDAGVDVRLTTYVDQPHGFHSLPGLTPLAAQATNEGVAFLRRRLGVGPDVPGQPSR